MSDQPTPTRFIAGETTVATIWRPTLGLRFVKRMKPNGRPRCVLQRLYVSTTGQREWREVELVSENG